MNPSTENLNGLIRKLIKLPAETEWVEFKHNNDNPQEIGEYIAALSNAAAFHGNKQSNDPTCSISGA
jgi:hypothetical protein